MLSPNDFGGKAKAPSIWSFDSGYSSTSIFEEEGVLSQPVQAGPSRPRAHAPVGLGLGGIQLTEEPTKLSVFTSQSNPDNDFFLPEISTESDTCLECEFWRITDPGENTKCPNCRLPEIIEPARGESLHGSRKGRDVLSRIGSPVNPQLQLLAKLQTTARCSACELSALIDPESKACPSCSPQPAYLLPISPKSPKSPRHKVKRSRAGRNSKLPLAALNRLQAWLDANQDNPYPNAETKRLLAQECGITDKQVTTWFTNARARQLNPLDRYLSSSSEDDGAEESDIADAAYSPTYSPHNAQPDHLHSPFGAQQPPVLPVNTGGFAYIAEPASYRPRAASVSGSSAFDVSTRQRPSRRGKKKDYRRNNATSPQTPTLPTPTSPFDTPQTDQEMWQCTFCHKSMVPKSWRRHEETQHRPKAEWTCMLYGPRLSLPVRSNSTSVCAFCMVKNPTEEHFLNNHRVEECAKRDISDRTYFRPDHLRQHIKNFHNASLFDIVQARWKRAAEARSEGWTCGFCGERLNTWDKRETHIANHFKDGLTMAAWKDYSELDQKVQKKSKEKRKEGDHPHALARLSRTFTRRSTRQSHSSYPQQQPQLHLQTSFANAFEPLPASMGLGISSAPVLPDIPAMGSLMDTSTGWPWVCVGSSGATSVDSIRPTLSTHNTADWSSLPTSLDSGVHMQYPLTNTNSFDPSIENAALQQEFDNSINMDLYSNPIDYHGPWDQHQHQNQQ